MNRIVYIFAALVLLITANEVKAFETYSFRKGYASVKSVCAENYRVFTRVRVPSSISCASICRETTGCDAVYFSADTRTCSGCKKTLTEPSPTSTESEYYQLVNDNIKEWSNGTSRYLLDLYRKMNFTDAKVYCQQFGAHVVVPDSKVEQDLLEYVARTAGVSSIWIGIWDANNTAPFLVEHSGEVANYTYWYPGEPKEYDIKEQCVYIYSDRQWKWNDTKCYSNQIHVVCEHDKKL